MNDPDRLANIYKQAPRHSSKWESLRANLLQFKYSWEELAKLRVLVSPILDQVMFKCVLYALAVCKDNPEIPVVYQIVNPFPEIIDTQGAVLFTVPDNKAKVFFRDLMPIANWGHPCKYILRYRDKDYVKDHFWPPADRFELKKREDK